MNWPKPITAKAEGALQLELFPTGEQLDANLNADAQGADDRAYREGLRLVPKEVDPGPAAKDAASKPVGGYTHDQRELYVSTGPHDGSAEGLTPPVVEPVTSPPAITDIEPVLQCPADVGGTAADTYRVSETDPHECGNCGEPKERHTKVARS